MRSFGFRGGRLALRNRRLPGVCGSWWSETAGRRCQTLPIAWICPRRAAGMGALLREQPRTGTGTVRGRSVAHAEDMPAGRGPARRPGGSRGAGTGGGSMKAACATPSTASRLPHTASRHAGSRRSPWSLGEGPVRLPLDGICGATGYPPRVARAAAPVMPLPPGAAHTVSSSAVRWLPTATSCATAAGPHSSAADGIGTDQ